MFYLQSNDALSFPAGTRNFTVLDISKYSPNESTSQATQEFTSDGGVENYRIDYYSVARTGTRTVTWTEEVDVWVEPEIAAEPVVVDDTDKDTETVDTKESTENPPVEVTCKLPHVDPDDDTFNTITVDTDKHWSAPPDDDPIDDGLLGNKNGSVADEAAKGAIVGAAAAAVIGASVVGGGIAGAVVGILAAVCCFIMLEARYGNGTMDKVVRRYRDEKMTERNRRGYYKVAEVLVPMMRKSKVTKWVVTKTFADPLVCYGKWYYGENKYGWIFKPVEKFWMKVFDTVGGEVQFIRENGEVV